MGTRPLELFHLFGELKNLAGIGPKTISNLKNLSKTAAFFSEKDEVIDDSYKLRNNEFISIIPPIGGG